MFEKMTLVVDVDGTLCPIKDKEEKYEDLVPYVNIVDKLRYYKKQGVRIVLNTSRNMNSYQGNLGLINARTAKILLAWLENWDIPYD